MANNTLLASDNFASGSLAAGWTTQSGLIGRCSVVSNGSSPSGYVTEPSATSTKDGQVWTGGVFGSDHVSEITLGPTATQESGTYTGLMVRAQASTFNWYEAYLNSSTLSVYKYISGTGTQLGSTVSGLTVSPGDMWTFMAVGSLLIVYQNSVQRFFIMDASLTGGSPGFWQYTTVNVTHTQVEAWRGYNTIQQDGIWQKQGIVLPATSADIGSSSNNGVYNTTQVLHEGNAQILSGTVYKIWAKGGPSSADLLYYESYDAKNWTRYGSSTLTVSEFSNAPVLFKVGSTYYLYLWDGTACNVYTSTTGISWTILGTHIANINPFGGVYWNGTFYLFALVTGSSGIGYQQSVYVYTSTDGQTFTAYSGNPVLTNAVGTQAIVQVNGVWYMWCPTGPAQGNALISTGNYGNDPSECVRHSSTDLLHWDVDTPAVRSVHHTQLFEGVNVTANTGGHYASAIIQVGNQTYLYGLSTPWDSSLPEPYQISLAIAPATLEQLVTANEDATQQTQTDAFTSGTGHLDGNWTTPTGGTALQIVSGPYVEPTATSTYCSAVYTGASFGPNQYSEVVLQTLAGTLTQSVIGPMVMASTAARTAYEGHIGSPTATEDAAAFIYKKVSGVNIQIGPTVLVEPQVGDVFRLSVIIGNDGFPVLSLFQNGFLVLQVQDQSASPLTTGNPGMFATSSVAIGDAQIASWAGGNANVIPNYPAVGGSWMQPHRDFVNKRGVQRG